MKPEQQKTTPGVIGQLRTGNWVFTDSPKLNWRVWISAAAFKWRVGIWRRQHDSMDPYCLDSDAVGVMVWILAWHTLDLLVPIQDQLNATAGENPPLITFKLHKKGSQVASVASTFLLHIYHHYAIHLLRNTIIKYYNLFISVSKTDTLLYIRSVQGEICALLQLKQVASLTSGVKYIAQCNEAFQGSQFIPVSTNASVA